MNIISFRLKKVCKSTADTYTVHTPVRWKFIMSFNRTCDTKKTCNTYNNIRFKPVTAENNLKWNKWSFLCAANFSQTALIVIVAKTLYSD